MLPVTLVHVGCITLTTGVEGVFGAVLMVIFLGADWQPSAVRTKTEYVPGNRLAKTGWLWKLTPSMLYVNAAPSGDWIVMVPVALAQLGWETAAVGMAGAPGGGLITKSPKLDTQPFWSRTVAL